MNEGRVESRLMTSTAGRILGVNNAGPIDCCIKDLSSGGAKIEVADARVLPTFFDLEIPQLGTAYHAETRWRYAHMLGVRFVRTLASAPGDDEPPTRDDLLDEIAELQDVVRALAERLTQLGEPLMITLKSRVPPNARVRRQDRQPAIHRDAADVCPYPL